MKIHRTPPMESFPDCMHPQDAFPRYKMPGIRPEQVVQLPDTYLQSMHIWYLWDRAADRVMAKHQVRACALGYGWARGRGGVVGPRC